MMDHHHSLRRKSTGSYNPTTLNSLTRKRQCSDSNSFRVKLNDDKHKSSDDISFDIQDTFITDVVEITATRYHNKAFELKILRKDQKEYEWVRHYRVIAPEAVANFLGNNALIKDVCQVFGKRIDKDGNIQYLVQRESSKSSIPKWIDCLKLLAPDKISKYEESESDKKIRLNKDISFEDVYIVVDQNIVPIEIIARVDICDELYYLARDEDDVLGLLPEKYLMDNYIEIVIKYYKLLAFNL